MERQRPDGILDLGTWMGRKQAFASISGGGSAAEAECLRQMRGAKKFRKLPGDEGVLPTLVDWHL